MFLIGGGTAVDRSLATTSIGKPPSFPSQSKLFDSSRAKPRNLSQTAPLHHSFSPPWNSSAASIAPPSSPPPLRLYAPSITARTTSPPAHP